MGQEAASACGIGWEHEEPRTAVGGGLCPSQGTPISPKPTWPGNQMLGREMVLGRAPGELLLNFLYGERSSRSSQQTICCSG